MEELREASEELRDRDLMVLDCTGFAMDAKKTVVKSSGRPVITPSKAHGPFN